jgi:hypothetical protein
MVRLISMLALVLAVMTGPAMADAKSEAKALCVAELQKKYGIPPSVSGSFSVSGSGERFTVAGQADYAGATNARVGCKTNKGRVTAVGAI